MRHATRRILVLLGLSVGVGAIPLTAFGWWTAGGTGSAGATAGTLVAPGAPSVSVASPNANLSWTGAAAPGAGAVGYYAERRPTAGTTWSAACGTSATATITSTTCTDTPGDGTFVWRVTAVFHSWTAVGASSSSVTVDAIPPTGSITAPLSGAAVKGTVTVTSDSADTGSGVASAQFQISPGGASSWSNLGSADTTAPYSVPWNTAAYADGAYDLRVVTTDNAGLTFASATVTNVVADNTAPTVAVALASGPTGAYLSPAKVLYFKASAAGSFGLVATVADAASGAASASFPALSATGWTTHSAQTVTTPAGGPYASSTFVWAGGASAPAAYTVTGADRAGSTATTGITFVVDSTAPTGSVTAPAALAIVRGTTSLTSNSADAGSGVASAQFQSAPHGTSTWTNAGAAVTTSPYTAAWDTTTVADGLYDLRVVTTDNVGTSFTSTTVANIRVDNTVPSGSVTAPAASANVTGTINVASNSADAGSGVASALFQRSPAGANTWTNIATADTSTPYAANWVTTGVTDGLYDLRAVTTDVAGNTFTSATVANVRVDNTAPTGSITSPAASANVRGTISVTSNSADTGSGVASALFQRSPAGANTWTNIATADTTSPYTASWTTTGVTDGLYDLRVITTDNLGIAFTSSTVANVRVDNTAPSGVVTAPVASTNATGTVGVTSNSADGGSGVASAQFQSAPHGTATWSNIGAADAVTPYAAAWDTTGVSDGLYDLRVITTDNAGNATTSGTIANIKVDNTAPTGSITSPAASASVRGTISVTSNSADAGSGVASALFQRSPAGANTWTSIATADTTSPYTASWTTTGVTDGLYDLRVITTDNLGIAFTSATIANVRVDNTAPTGTITAPTASAGVAGTISVTSNSADTGSGVASALFQRSPAGAGAWTNIATADTASPYDASWVTTGVADGLYDLRVVTTDNAGNITTSSAVANVRVDNTAPTGSITAPAANAFVSGAAIAITSNSADGGSGVASAQFQSAPHGTATWSVVGTDTGLPYSVTGDSTTVADGLYDLRVVTTDNAGNTFTSAVITVEVQNAAPSATSLKLLDGAGTAGMIQQSDRIVVTFSQTLRVSSLCSTWSGDLTDQSLATANNVTVTITDGGVAADTLTVASTSCIFHFGAIGLGSTGYATGGTMTFSGTSAANRSTIAWSASTHTLTITLGQKAGAGTAGAVATSAALYTPDSAIRNALGTAITGTFGTGTLTQF